MSNEFLLHSPIIQVSFEEDIAILQPMNKALLAVEAKELKDLFETGLKNDVTRYIIDLSKADYISSEALGSVASCWNECKEGEQGRMAVVLAPDEQNEVRNLFDIIGLSRMLGNGIKTSRSDAVNYIKEFA